MSSGLLHSGQEREAPTSESLERPSKRRRTPSQKAATSEFNAASFLDAHFSQVQTFVLLGMRPASISARLQRDFGVEISSKLISNKIKNWKVNGKIKVPPVDSANARATDDAYPPAKCMFFSIIFYLIFQISFRERYGKWDQCCIFSSRKRRR